MANTQLILQRLPGKRPSNNKERMILRESILFAPLTYLNLHDTDTPCVPCVRELSVSEGNSLGIKHPTFKSQYFQ